MKLDGTHKQKSITVSPEGIRAIEVLKKQKVGFSQFVNFCLLMFSELRLLDAREVVGPVSQLYIGHLRALKELCELSKSILACESLEELEAIKSELTIPSTEQNPACRFIPTEDGMALQIGIVFSDEDGKKDVVPYGDTIEFPITAHRIIMALKNTRLNLEGTDNFLERDVEQLKVYVDETVSETAKTK